MRNVDAKTIAIITPPSPEFDALMDLLFSIIKSSGVIDQADIFCVIAAPKILIICGTEGEIARLNLK